MIENLFTIKYKDDNKAIVELCDKSHPLFKAHFPDSPILPGFINLEIVAKIFDIKITSVKRAKFLKLIHPNQTLTYLKNGDSFKVLCEGEDVANFIL